MLSKRIKTAPMLSIDQISGDEENNVWIDIIEQAHAPIFGVDTKLKVYKWNRMAETISGYSKTEVIGKPFLDFIEPELRESVGTVLHKALCGENTANYQQQLITKEGDIRILMLNATAKRDKDQISGVVGIAQDITELVELQRKELERKEKEWTDNLMSIFKGLNNVFVWNFRGNFKNHSLSKFLAASDGCESILGYTQKELCEYQGCIMEALMIPESYHDYKKVLMSYETEDEPYTNSVGSIYTLKNGRRISINIIPQKRENGHMDFMGITIDVPDREQLELILESTQELILIDDGPERTFEWVTNKLKQNTELDVNTIMSEIPKTCWPMVIYASPSWIKFGYNETPVGKYIIDIVGSDKQEAPGPYLFIESILHSIKTNNSSEMVKTIHGKINSIDAESVLSPMGDNKILSVTRDVSERVKRFELEKQVVAKDIAREKDRQTNKVVRHETKNGLLSAIGHTRDFIEMHKEAEKDGQLNTMSYQEDILGRYSELHNDLHYMLQTTMSDALARDIIHGDYQWNKNLAPCNLIDLNRRIRGSRYVWDIYPRNFPEIMFDGQVYFYILRNATTNALKYGKRGGPIVVSLSLKYTTLEMKVENLPGENHEELMALEDPNIIFNQGTRLHTLDSKVNMKSAGDGGFIMSECSKASGGTISINFTKEKTIFTYLNDKIDACITNSDVEEFQFPVNTVIYGIDDCKMQRKILTRAFSGFGLPIENRIIRGDGMNEVLSLGTFLLNKILDCPKHYHVIICDENLDYSDDHDRTCSESGSRVCQQLLRVLDSNYKCLTLIRSANNSLEETTFFETMVHGVVPKILMKPDDIRRTIAPIWFNKFGIVTPSNNNHLFDDNISDIIDLYMDDLKFFLERENSKSNWSEFWSELHKIKGSILSLHDIINSEYIVRLIEKLRDNKFDETFEEKWAYIKDALIDYQRKILAYLESKPNCQTT